MAGPPAEVDAGAGGGIEEASKGTIEEPEPASKGFWFGKFPSLLSLRQEKKRQRALAAICTRSSRGLVLGVLVDEIDISEEQDAAQHAQEGEKTKAAHEIKKWVYYCALVASPPCSTFSRSRSSGLPGPRPLRSRRWPRGFPWLTPRALQSVKDANTLIDFREQAIREQSATSSPYVILEHPEDLGRRKTCDPRSGRAKRGEDRRLAASRLGEQTTKSQQGCWLAGLVSKRFWRQGGRGQQVPGTVEQTEDQQGK